MLKPFESSCQTGQLDLDVVLVRRGLLQSFVYRYPCATSEQKLCLNSYERAIINTNNPTELIFQYLYQLSAFHAIFHFVPSRNWTDYKLVRVSGFNKFNHIWPLVWHHSLMSLSVKLLVGVRMVRPGGSGKLPGPSNRGCPVVKR